MSDTVKVNPGTGQVAVLRGGNWHIFSPGQYKVNPATGQVALPDVNAKGYEIHDAPDVTHALSSPDALMQRQTGGDPVAQAAALLPAGAQPSTPDPNTFKQALQPPPRQVAQPSDIAMSQGESALRGGMQGVTLGTQDEIGGATAALIRSLYGDKAPIDPAHPITGGMSSGFGANYLNEVAQERALNQAAKESNPKTYKGAFFGGAMLPALAMPANTMLQAGASGAIQGGLLSAGLSDTENMKKLLLNGAVGGIGGGILGMGARGLQSLAFDSTTPSGIAYNALGAASDGDIGGIQVRPSSVPAETDPRMTDMLGVMSQINGPAASQAVPAARARLAAVNNAIAGQVDNISPADSAALLDQIQQQAQNENALLYQQHRNSPRLMRTPAEIAQRPSFTEAMNAAQAAAADEWPARQVNPNALTATDTELIDKALSKAQRLALDTHGVDTQTALNQQARIPTRGDIQNNFRTMADAIYPDLPTARQNAAQAFGLENAVDTGKGWLKSTTSAEQVGNEFNAMTPEQQQAALSSFATDLRNTIGTKTGRQNLGLIFEKNAIADKLANLGFPQQTIDQITAGGAGARGMLDALTGGSRTARNLSTKDAMQSTLSAIKSGDVTAGAVTGSPVVTMLLPMMRNAGDAATREAARRLIVSLTSPGGGGLASIVNHAPQVWGGIANAPFRTAGGLANQTPIVGPLLQGLLSKGAGAAGQLLPSWITGGGV